MSDQQQPPLQPGQAPPQGYYQGPPPKKKHTVRNVFLVLAGLLVLFIGGCAVLFGAAVNEVDKAIEDEEANDKPVAVKEGAAFTHDGFEATEGWTVAKDPIGGVTIKGLSVTNTEGEARTALLSFRFYKGKTNLAQVECSSNELQADESSNLDCFSTDTEYPNGYSTIKVADSF